MLSLIEVVELALGKSVCVANISLVGKAYVSLPKPESMSLSSDSFMGQPEPGITRT